MKRSCQKINLCFSCKLKRGFMNLGLVSKYLLNVSVTQLSPSFLQWTIAHQDPLAMEFSSHEYLMGLLFPSPGDLPEPGIKSVYLVSPAFTGRFFTAEPLEKPQVSLYPKLKFK